MVYCSDLLMCFSFLNFGGLILPLPVKGEQCVINTNKLKISVALFPDVIKSALQKVHIKLSTILNGDKVKVRFKVIR